MRDGTDQVDEGEQYRIKRGASRNWEKFQAMNNNGHLYRNSGRPAKSGRLKKADGTSEKNGNLSVFFFL